MYANKCVASENAICFCCIAIHTFNVVLTTKYHFIVDVSAAAEVCARLCN